MKKTSKMTTTASAPAGAERASRDSLPSGGKEVLELRTEAGAAAARSLGVEPPSLELAPSYGTNGGTNGWRWSIHFGQWNPCGQLNIDVCLGYRCVEKRSYAKVLTSLQMSLEMSEAFVETCWDCDCRTMSQAHSVQATAFRSDLTHGFLSFFGLPNQFKIRFWFSSKT